MSKKKQPQMLSGDYIAYGSASGSLFTFNGKTEEVADYSNPPIKNEIIISPWAPWTDNNIGALTNNMPIEMAQRIRTCGVLSAGLEAKARIAIGTGIKPVFITGIDKDGKEILEFVNDPEICEFMHVNRSYRSSIATIRNLLGYGWSHGRFILTNDGDKIAKYKTDDIVKCRLGRYDATTRKMLNTYIAADWRNIPTSCGNDEYVKVIDMLEEGNEYDDLQENIAAGIETKEYSIITRGPLNDMVYYPRPLWYSCLNWVNMAIQVPAMKMAMMNNQMTIKYVFTISEQYFRKLDENWDTYSFDERRTRFQEKAAEMDRHLTGTDKAYKSIFTTYSIDPATGANIPDIKIDVIDDKIADGKLLPDSGAANKEILFALMVNPTILGTNTFGGDYSGGAGSGSDIREAALLQTILMEAEREENANIYNIISKINGWDKKYPGRTLAFRYPALMLTTLDTGAGTGSTVAAIPTQNNKPAQQ